MPHTHKRGLLNASASAMAFSVLLLSSGQHVPACTPLQSLQEALLKSLNSRFRTHSTEWRPQQRGMTSHHHHPAKLSRPVSGAERGRHIRRRQSSAQDFMSRLLESRSGQLDDSTCDEIGQSHAVCLCVQPCSSFQRHAAREACSLLCYACCEGLSRQGLSGSYLQVHLSVSHSSFHACCPWTLACTDEADLRGPSRDNSPHRHKPAHHSDLEAAPRGLQTPTPDLSPPYSASSLPTANCANPTASAPQRTCEPTPSACTFLQPSKVPEQEPPSFPPWQDLPPGLLCHIVLFLGDTAATLMPPCGTCKSWRDALAHNQWLLKRTWFNLSLDAPCKPAAGHPPAGAAATASCSSARAAAAAGASAQATAQLQRASSERPPLQRQRYMLGLSGAAGALRTSADAAQPAEQRSAEDSSGVMAASDAKALLQGVPVLLTEAARLRNATATGVLAQLHEVGAQSPRIVGRLHGKRGCKHWLHAPMWHRHHS